MTIAVIVMTIKTILITIKTMVMTIKTIVLNTNIILSLIKAFPTTLTMQITYRIGRPYCSVSQIQTQS